MKRPFIKVLLMYLLMHLWFFESAAQAGDISKAQAAKIAQKTHGGKVIKVSKSGSVYQVKLLLENGRVKTVSVDATGR